MRLHIHNSFDEQEVQRTRQLISQLLEQAPEAELVLECQPEYQSHWSEFNVPLIASSVRDHHLPSPSPDCPSDSYFFNCWSELYPDLVALYGKTDETVIHTFHRQLVEHGLQSKFVLPLPAPKLQEPTLTAEELIARALDSLAQKNYRRALADTTLGIEINGKVRDLHHVHALALIALNNLYPAKYALETELRQFPDNEAARKILAEVDTELGLLALKKNDDPFAESPSQERTWSEVLTHLLQAKTETITVHHFLGNTQGNPLLREFASTAALIFRSFGIESQIFDESAGDSHYSNYRPKKSGTEYVICYATDSSSELLQYTTLLPVRKILFYQQSNFEQLENWSPERSKALAQTRLEIQKAKESFEDCFCVSSAALKEVSALGYEKVNLLPLPFHGEPYNASAIDPNIVSRFRDGHVNIFASGSLSHENNLEQILEAFAVYQTKHHPRSRLILAGGNHDSEKYLAHIQQKVHEASIQNVVIATQPTEQELISCYRISHVFLSMSESEESILPLQIAMNFRLPIIAYANDALRDALGKAAIILDSTEAEKAAFQIHQLRINNQLRDSLTSAQERQLEHFSESQLAEGLAEFFSRKLYKCSDFKGLN